MLMVNELTRTLKKAIEMYIFWGDGSNKKSGDYLHMSSIRNCKLLKNIQFPLQSF